MPLPRFVQSGTKSLGSPLKRVGEKPMPDGKPSNRPTMGSTRLAGAGVELAATIGVACLVGYWIDRKFGTEPWGLLILAAIGIVGGLYNLVRLAVHDMFKPPRENPTTRGSGDEGHPSDKS